MLHGIFAPVHIKKVRLPQHVVINTRQIQVMAQGKDDFASFAYLIVLVLTDDELFFCFNSDRTSRTLWGTNYAP